MTAISIHVVAASFFSTHHASAADALAGTVRPITPPTFPLLVARARRFTSLVTQMHLEVCGALAIDPAAPPATVFATCHGEIQTADMLLADFRANAMVSSARFALSVHNTPSGLYSVATASTAPSTTVTGSNAIAASWLEAALTVLDGDGTVLLSIADEPVPAVFHGPPEPAGVAAAFLLASGSRGRSAQLVITPASDDAEVDTALVLARTAHAATSSAPATIRLGRIQPGHAIELRFT